MMRCTGLLAVALVLGGCIQLGEDTAPTIRRHALGVARVETETRIDASVSVPLFDARARYGMRVVEADEVEGALSYLEFERWAEDPRDGLTDTLREALAGAGAFRSVSRADSGLRADMELRGFIGAFDVVRDDAGAQARLSLRLTLSDSSTDELRRSAVYEAQRPLPGDGTAGLGAAMTACVADVLGQALADWSDVR